MILASTMAFTAQAQNRTYPQITEQNWTIACSNYAVISDLISPYKEKPLIAGEMGSGNMIFFFNKETGTWTFVAMDGRIACVLADGKNGQIILEQGINKK